MYFSPLLEYPLDGETKLLLPKLAWLLVPAHCLFQPYVLRRENDRKATMTITLSLNKFILDIDVINFIRTRKK